MSNKPEKKGQQPAMVMAAAQIVSERAKTEKEESANATHLLPDEKEKRRIEFAAKLEKAIALLAILALIFLLFVVVFIMSGSVK